MADDDDLPRPTLPPIDLKENEDAMVHIIRELRKHDCDVNAVDKTGNTALHYATKDNNLAKVKAILLPDPNDHVPLATWCDTNVKDKDGYTPLTFAAWYGFGEICLLLLENGAFIDISGVDGHTALSLACRSEHAGKNIVRMLLERNKQENPNVNTRDRMGHSPLHYVAMKGDGETAECLLTNGANADASNNENATPLWNAVYYKNEPVVEVLLKRNAKFNISSKGFRDSRLSDEVLNCYEVPRNPFWVACHEGALTIAKMLVLAGVNLYDQSWMWDDPERPKALQDDPKTMDWLLKQASLVQPLQKMCVRCMRQSAGSKLKEWVDTLSCSEAIKQMICTPLDVSIDNTI